MIDSVRTFLRSSPPERGPSAKKLDARLRGHERNSCSEHA